MSNKLKGVIEDKDLKVIVKIAEAGPKGDKPAHRWVGTTQVQFENPDGTWGDVVDLNPEVVVMHQEQFEAIGEAQEVFTLTEGVYRPGTNALSWYMYGQKQPNEALNELSPSTFSIKGGVPEGAHILVEYLEFANVAIGLKGEKGDVGLQGKSLEFSWNDTQLGIRAEGDSVYQYVDLKGPQGPEGPPGSDATVTQTNIERALGYTPVSPTQLATKVDKVTGKGLSTEDYTTTEKTKLSGIEENANAYTHPLTHSPSIIAQDANNRFVTDTEKSIWNNKQDSLGYTPENIANKGVTNGYASLDSNGKIPLSQIPDATFNTYTYYQITPSDNWVIKHNLNKYPSVTIVDSSNNVVVGEVKYIDNNTINISLVGVFAGTVYLN